MSPQFSTPSNSSVTKGDSMKHDEMGGLMTTSDLVVYLRVSRVTIWRKRCAGVFPKPCDLGDNQLRWRRRDIDTWIDFRETRDPLCAPKPAPRPEAHQFGRLL